MRDTWQNVKGIATKFKGLTTIGITNIAGSAISGIFWFYIAKLLGTAHYGEVSYVIAISGIALTFSLFGSSNALLVYSAKGIKIQPPIFFISIVAIAIASVISYFIFYNIGLCLLIIGNGTFGLATLELLGLKLYKKYGQYFIIQRILMVGLAILLYYLLGYNGVIIGIGLSYFPAMIRVYRVFKGSKIDFSLIKTRFGFLFISYVLDISRTFGANIDKIIVAPLLGFALLGNYQLGVQFLSVLTIFPSILYYYIVPHDSSGTSNVRLKKISIIISVGLAIPSIVLSPFVVPILFPKFTEAVRVIQIISLSIIPVTISNIYISKFLATEKIRIVLIGSSIFIVIQVTTIFLLGKIFSVNGVATSYVLAATAEAIYLIFINRLYFKDQPKEKEVSQDNNVVSQDNNVVVKNVQPRNILDFSWRTALFSLLVIGSIGLFLRIHYFPHNVPLNLDALNSYFFYATDISILGHLPSWPVPNNGWPIFLSFFFSIFHYNNFLDYMNLQRIVSISISVITIVPVYLLCRRFFARSYSIIGTALFAFEPHIIQNSLLGLTDPLFIILVASSIVLFLSSKMKMTVVAFALVALLSIVRIEGLFVFFGFSIAFFIRYRKDIKFTAKYYIAALATFVVILLPMALLRMKLYGNDFLTNRAVSSATSIVSVSIQASKAGVTDYFATIKNIMILGGLALIPILIILIPLGIFLILKNKEAHRTTIFIIMILMMIPVVVAFSETQDTRYIFPLFPLFCVLSVLPIKRKLDNAKNRNIFLVLVVAVILSSGIAYLDIKKYDYAHEREAYGIATHVVSVANGINDYYPEDSYITVAQIPANWPVLKTSIQFNTSVLPTTGFDSLEKYIESSRDKGLTHIAVDGAKNRPSFLNDVFYHEEKFPYLVKVFDSWDYGYKYHLKIYKIDYNKFNK